MAAGSQPQYIEPKLPTEADSIEDFLAGKEDLARMNALVRNWQKREAASERTLGQLAERRIERR